MFNLPGFTKVTIVAITVIIISGVGVVYFLPTLNPTQLFIYSINRWLPSSPVESEPLSITTEFVFSGNGEQKSEYLAGKDILIAMKYINNSKHVAVVSIPYCGTPTKVSPIVDGVVSTETVYDNAQNIQTCKATKSRLVEKTIEPGEGLGQLVGLPFGTKLPVGTYQIEFAPQIVEVELDPLIGTFTVVQ